MAREDFANPTNPYHYALHCLGGKWKMTILHEIYTHGSIHFNQTLKVLPLSEKVLSQQLKELISDGLVRRIVSSDTFPPSTEYELTEEAADLILRSQVNKIISKLREQKNIEITIEDFAYKGLEEAATFDLSNGGRGIGNQVESLVINPLSRWLFDHEITENAKIVIEGFETAANPPSIRCRVEGGAEA